MFLSADLAASLHSMHQMEVQNHLSSHSSADATSRCNSDGCNSSDVCEGTVTKEDETAPINEELARKQELSVTDCPLAYSVRFNVMKETPVVTALKGSSIDTGEEINMFKCHMCAGPLFVTLSGIQQHLATHVKLVKPQRDSLTSPSGTGVSGPQSQRVCSPQLADSSPVSTYRSPQQMEDHYVKEKTEVDLEETVQKSLRTCNKKLGMQNCYSSVDKGTSTSTNQSLHLNSTLLPVCFRVTGSATKSTYLENDLNAEIEKIPGQCTGRMMPESKVVSDDTIASVVTVAVEPLRVKLEQLIKIVKSYSPLPRPRKRKLKYIFKPNRTVTENCVNMFDSKNETVAELLAQKSKCMKANNNTRESKEDEISVIAVKNFSERRTANVADLPSILPQPINLSMTKAEQQNFNQARMTFAQHTLQANETCMNSHQITNLNFSAVADNSELGYPVSAPMSPKSPCSVESFPVHRLAYLPNEKVNVKDEVLEASQSHLCDEEEDTRAHDRIFEHGWIGAPVVRKCEALTSTPIIPVDTPLVVDPEELYNPDGSERIIFPSTIHESIADMALSKHNGTRAHYARTLLNLIFKRNNELLLTANLTGKGRYRRINPSVQAAIRDEVFDKYPLQHGGDVDAEWKLCKTAMDSHIRKVRFNIKQKLERHHAFVDVNDDMGIMQLDM